MTNIKTQLSFLQRLIDDLNTSNSQVHKLEVLNKYKSENEPLLRKLLSYVYDYDKTYGLTSKNVEKNLKMATNNATNFDDLFKLLDSLVARKITGHAAIATILKNNNDSKTLYPIINKDLKSQISEKIINKALPGCIKTFSVALANKIQDQRQDIDFDSGEWIFERKLDGVRNVSIQDIDGNIHFISRQGREFKTLENLKQPVKEVLEKAKSLYHKDFVLDGECCMMNEKGDEDFSAVMQEITMKNHTIERPMYVVFDLIPKDEFEQTKPPKIQYIDRLKMLENVMSAIDTDKIKVVENVKTTNKEVFEQWQKIVKDQNWEGLCIRLKNSLFQAKRTNDLIKVKSFFDEEFTVKDIELGSMKMLRNGIMTEVECVKSLIIEAEDGTRFNCGSGLSTEQRVDWMKHPEKIIGSLITVAYFEKSIDKKTGIPSLRFPTLKYVFTKEQSKGGRQL